MTVLLFCINLALLMGEGYLIGLGLGLGPSTSRGVTGLGSKLGVALALPIAALSNVLIFFLFTLLRIPLSPVTLWPAHAAVIGVLGVMAWRSRRDDAAAQGDGLTRPTASGRAPLPPTSLNFGRAGTMTSPALARTHLTWWQKVLAGLCVIILGVNFLYAVVHGVVLPTYQVDSLTNWTQRSQVSFYDQAIAFDDSEDRGVAKPQYPILLHSLQILVNQGNSEWNDRTANMIVFLLILSQMAAIFLLLRTLRGGFTALVTLALLCSMPLFQVHLAPGYGDMPMMLYVVLSLLSFVGVSEERDRIQKMQTIQSIQRSWFFALGSLFVVAACWTKLEGAELCIPPMLFTVWLFSQGERWRWRTWVLPIVVIVFSLLYSLLLIAKGLPVTPHVSDAFLEYSPEAARQVLPLLFADGAFGIVWYGIIAVVMVSLTNHDNGGRWTLVWGAYTFLLILFVYTCTPNSRFLLNQESFLRQMMIPAALFVIGLSLIFSPTKEDEE